MVNSFIITMDSVRTVVSRCAATATSHCNRTLTTSRMPVVSSENHNILPHKSFPVTGWGHHDGMVPLSVIRKQNIAKVSGRFQRRTTTGSAYIHMLFTSD